MKQYLVILWHNKGRMEFKLISDKYPMDRDIVSASGLNWDDIVDYEVHY